MQPAISIVRFIGTLVTGISESIHVIRIVITTILEAAQVSMQNIVAAIVGE